MSKAEPIQSDVPQPGLTPQQLALDIVSRIERGNHYARTRKRRFRRQSSIVRVASIVLSVTSTIILGLQTLTPWEGFAFALVATVTAVNALEPFFAWRSRWVLMEETQGKFYHLRDELTYYIASRRPEQIEESRVREFFDRYQNIWGDLSSRWMEYRRAVGRGE
jgi:hypothetical protein